METYGDNLLGNEPGNLEQFRLFAGDAEQERDREQAVTQNGLNGEFWVVNVEVSSPPGEETVDQAHSGNNAEERGDDGTGDLDTKPSTVGEGVEGVLSLVLVIIGNHDTASRKSLLGLRISHLGDGQGGGDRHDARGHKRLSVQTEADVTDQHGTGDGRKTTGHDLV